MEEARKAEYYTIEEFYAVMGEKRAELIGGVIYDMSPASNRMHQTLAAYLFYQIAQFIDSKNGSCKPILAPFDVKLFDDTVVQPDVSVICDSKKLTEKGCDGAPDWVSEIVSDNAVHDYIRKFRLYADSGVREYWIVDPKRRMTTVYGFGSNESFNLYSFDETVPAGIYDGELTIHVGKLIEKYY